MKRSLLPLAVLSILLYGCAGSPSSATPDDPSVAPSDPAVTPTGARASESLGDAVLTCDDVTLVLDPDLASDTTCEIVPAFDDPVVGHPRYVRIELSGYPITGPVVDAEISIYPVSEFQLMVYLVPGIVARFEESISTGNPTEGAWGHLPFLYNPDQGQFFYAQYETFPFKSGTGIRYLTGFTQDRGVMDNVGLRYTYQAMTDDGEYWVSALFSITSPVLPMDEDWPPEGMTEYEFSANYDTYVADYTAALNAEAPGNFTPTIDALDALVASITITP